MDTSKGQLRIHILAIWMQVGSMQDVHEETDD